MLDIARPHVALYVGGMGARDKNFYNTICQKYGYVDEAIEIQDLYLPGKKEEAAAAVPAELLAEHQSGWSRRVREGADRGVPGGRRDPLVGHADRRPDADDRAAARPDRLISRSSTGCQTSPAPENDPDADRSDADRSIVDRALPDPMYDEFIDGHEQRLVEQRQNAIEAGRRKGGLAGAAMAGAMFAIAEIYEGPKGTTSRSRSRRRVTPRCRPRRVRGRGR